MDSQTALGYVERCKLMAGMRGEFPPDVALATVETLMQEGINVFECLSNSVEPVAAMQTIKRTFGDDACVGMGTVLDPESAHRMIDAGADFIVSPAFQPEVVQVALDADVLVAPGVLTPTEAVLAWNMGVTLLKFFPGGAVGLDYFQAIRGPLDHMRFMVNGAMNAENVPKFLKAGAVACGMAGWLTGDGTLGQDVIRSRARLLQQAIDIVEGRPRSV